MMPFLCIKKSKHMWDESSEGLYVSPDQDRVDLSKKFATWQTVDLMKYVSAYEEWMRKGNIWDFNSVFRGYRHSAFSENMKELKENLNLYDAMCRELAKRLLRSGIEIPK